MVNASKVMLDVIDLPRIGTFMEVFVNPSLLIESIIFYDQVWIELWNGKEIRETIRILGLNNFRKLLNKGVFHFIYFPVEYGIRRKVDELKIGIPIFEQSHDNIEDLIDKTLIDMVSNRKDKEKIIISILNQTKKAPIESFKSQNYIEIIAKELNSTTLFRRFLDYSTQFVAIKNSLIYKVVRDSEGQLWLKAPLLSQKECEKLTMGLSFFMLPVSKANLLAYCCNHFDITSIWGTLSTNAILEDKLSRSFKSAHKEADAAAHLIKLEKDIPDIGTMLRNGQITINDVIKIRKNAVDLRKLLSDLHSADEQDVNEAYLNALQYKSSKINSIPTKLLRYLIISGIGVINPVTGAFLSAVDMFGSDWVGGQLTKSIRLKDVFKGSGLK